MIITIDGPAASGKSTVAYRVAQKTDSFYINSGLLFRAVAWIGMEKLDELSVLQSPGFLTMLLNNDFAYTYTQEDGPALFYKGEYISPFLKSPEVSSYASIVATEPTVREALLVFQRMLAQNRNIVADGRDCGTVIFPYATYTFFITAQETVRAERLQKELAHQGKQFSLEETLQLLKDRDNRDSRRAHAPLTPSKTAIYIDSSFLSIEEAVDAVLSNLTLSTKN